MKRAKRDPRVSHSLFSPCNFLMFFCASCFLITACFLLFLDGMALDPELVRRNAPFTLFNILFLSLLFTLLDGLRHKLTIERPVSQLLEATQRISAGDFSVRLAPMHGLGRQNELDVITEDFNLMVQELGSIETLRGDFISNVSHELKTPLAAMQNYAVLLQDPALPPEKRLEYAKAVGDSTRRLTALITNILKLNKLENQQIYPTPAVYDLSEQLCECLLQFENVWEQKKLELESDLADGVLLRADAELLALVWNNLFSNAMKFTPPGGRVCVGLALQQGWAVVTVSDTGCGMDAETGKHIFEKFYQADTSHATQGNGLGLALVKRVIDITGGEIGVESRVGVGSTFTVRLKAANADNG